MSVIDVPSSGRAWREAVATASALPTSGNFTGDIRLVIDSRRIYRWTGSAWAYMGVLGNTISTGVTDMPTGSVGFRGPNHGIDYDENNFFYSDTFNTLGIGTATPTAAMHVNGSMRIDGSVGFYSTTPPDQYLPSGANGYGGSGGYEVRDDSTWTGDISSNTYRISDIVRALKLIGILAM
jgi:hypothetical protein